MRALLSAGPSEVQHDLDQSGLGGRRQREVDDDRAIVVERDRRRWRARIAGRELGRYE